jgi:PAS domain S-box-containing protein
MTTESPKILIVEDEQVVALDLERSLSGLGYRIVGVADNGRQAVQLAEANQPDLVLMDVRLRGPMDGITAAHEIRRRCQAPVVYTTAYTNDETIERAKASAPFGFLVKPYRTKELNATIAMALHQHRVAQEVIAGRTWLGTILDGIRDCVVATDAEGRLRYLNPAAERLLGWRGDEASDKPIEEVYELTDLEGRPLAARPLRRVLAGDESATSERAMLLGRDGRRVPVEISATLVRDARGEPSSAVSVFHDISDRLRIERAEAEERRRMAERVESTERALTETRGELRGLAASVMNAQEEAGRRIARELHDDFSQRLALLELEAYRLGLEAIPGEVSSGLERIGERAAQLSADLRVLSHRLHPSILENLGLAAAIGALADDFRRQEMEITYDEPRLAGRVPDEAAIGLYRIAQEALANAAKHAPGAPIEIALVEGPEELELRVRDEGPGFDPEAARRHGGLGLLGMKERARLAGGTIDIRSRPGGPTTIVARVKREGHA